MSHSDSVVGSVTKKIQKSFIFFNRLKQLLLQLFLYLSGFITLAICPLGKISH